MLIELLILMGRVHYIVFVAIGIIQYGCLFDEEGENVLLLLLLLPLPNFLNYFLSSTIRLV